MEAAKKRTKTQKRRDKARKAKATKVGLEERISPCPLKAAALQVACLVVGFIIARSNCVNHEFVVVRNYFVFYSVDVTSSLNHSSANCRILKPLPALSPVLSLIFSRSPLVTAALTAAADFTGRRRGDGRSRSHSGCGAIGRDCG
jgi:hypothetical protein